MIRLEDITKRDYRTISHQIQQFILNKKTEAGAEGIVIGLSGGVDSSASTYLACRALGKEGVLGLIMPDARVTPKQDIDDAKTIAKTLRVDSKLIDIATIHQSYMRHLPQDKISEGNLRARIRMTILYHHAKTFNRLVLGTGDRSEALIGYFTKYGDGGVDLQPLAGLYKTQVKELARFLAVPSQIISKKSSPRLWRGHEAETEIGASYEDIDRILYTVFDLNFNEKKASEETGLNMKLIRRILAMHKQSTHKRNPPPVMQPPK
ncbi:MAG: NAD+ synthase [Thaumarchaeota archaeon]|nr:NAD+ synthase [Nitrososphaerota archaeon]